MTDQDLFFTHTVVGQARSVPLGRRLTRQEGTSAPEASLGLHADMVNSKFDLPQAWQDWCLIQGTYPYAGLPRRSPGKTRRWLERHALVLAAVSVLVMCVGLVFIALAIWFPHHLNASVGAVSAPGMLRS